MTAGQTEGFAGKVAVISGASSGIGRSYARALGAAGAQVVLVGRNQQRLAGVAEEVGADRALTVAADVAEVGASERIIDAAIERFGTVDIVLANAGLYLGGDLAEAEPVAIEQLVSVNVFGAMALARAALPVLQEKKGGDVLFTGSVSGYQSIHWEPVYTATKHAVQAFAHAMRRQLVGSGVRIGSVAPGVVLNELWGFDESDPGSSEHLANGTGITSEDVADAVLYMLSRPRHVNIRDLVILPTNQEI